MRRWDERSHTPVWLSVCVAVACGEMLDLIGVAAAGCRRWGLLDTAPLTLWWRVALTDCAGLNGSEIFAKALADIVTEHLDRKENFSPQYKQKCLSCTKPMCRQILNPAY